MKNTINEILEFVHSILELIEHKESSQIKIKDAEVITAAIIAGIYFNGNFQKTLTFFEDYPHFEYVLSKSRFSRRLSKLGSTLSKIMDIIMEYNKNRSKNKEFMIDSFPVAACDNFRIPRCKIYLDHDLYRGYVSSKRNFFSEQGSI